MRNIFTSFSVLFTLVFTLQSCSPSSNIDNTFEGVEKITFQKINLDGSKELLFELSEPEQIKKVTDCVDLKSNGTSGCEFTVLMTFYKPNVKIEGYSNFNAKCKSIAYTYNSNFYTKTLTEEGAKYLAILTGIM